MISVNFAKDFVKVDDKVMSYDFYLQNYLHKSPYVIKIDKALFKKIEVHNLYHVKDIDGYIENYLLPFIPVKKENLYYEITKKAEKVELNFIEDDRMSKIICGVNKLVKFKINQLKILLTLSVVLLLQLIGLGLILNKIEKKFISAKQYVQNVSSEIKDHKKLKKLQVKQNLELIELINQIVKNDMIYLDVNYGKNQLYIKGVASNEQLILLKQQLIANNAVIIGCNLMDFFEVRAKWIE